MADSVERTPAVVLEERRKGRPRGQQVVEILRSAIITGGYEPGERLIEATLSTELGRAAARSGRRSASSRTRAS